MIDIQDVAQILLDQYFQNTVLLLNMFHSLLCLVNKVKVHVLDQSLHLQIADFNLKDAANNIHVEEAIHA
jgi:hypothetical protein